MRRRTRSACEIGSEGDPLAGEDECSLTRVGPKRVGAYTRPARYEKYRRPRHSDRLGCGAPLPRPRFFLGGEMRLDSDAAHTAVKDQVARLVGYDPMRAATRTMVLG